MDIVKKHNDSGLGWQHYRPSRKDPHTERAELIVDCARQEKEDDEEGEYISETHSY